MSKETATDSKPVPQETFNEENKPTFQEFRRFMNSSPTGEDPRDFVPVYLSAPMYRLLRQHTNKYIREKSAEDPVRYPEPKSKYQVCIDNSYGALNAFTTALNTLPTSLSLVFAEACQYFPTKNNKVARVPVEQDIEKVIKRYQGLCEEAGIYCSIKRVPYVGGSVERAAALCKEANDSNVSQIIIGQKATADPNASHIIGSTSLEVIKQSPVPVLVVKEKPTYLRGPFEGIVEEIQDKSERQSTYALMEELLAKDVEYENSVPLPSKNEIRDFLHSKEDISQEEIDNFMYPDLFKEEEEKELTSEELMAKYGGKPEHLR